MVGMHGDDIVIVAFGRRLSQSDAINLAAWLVVLADPSFEVVGKPKTDFGKAVAEARS